MAADSRAASSGRHRTIRSTSAMMSRRAAGSRRRSDGRLFSVILRQRSQAFADAQAGGAGFAVDEDSCHGSRSPLPRRKVAVWRRKSKRGVMHADQG